ncbi:hypothetical protein Pen01_26070 [Phytomonospora endophytica]|nr:hypothetical protein Pen01_26070 [Phytomonospora endophytica]
MFSAVSVACSPDVHVVEHFLDGALRTSRTMIARYDAVLPTVDGDRQALLTALRADHEAHASALALRIGAGASLITAAAFDAEPSVKELRKAESEAHKEAVDQCVASEEPQAARLLASIAASRAAHRELLHG